MVNSTALAATLLAFILLASLAGCEEGAISQGGVPEDASANSKVDSSPNARASRPAEAGPRESTSVRAADKTFDDIKFEIDKGEPFVRTMLTDKVTQLFGERIRIRGFILPTYRKRGIDRFVLVRDNQECCFGPGAALYDCVRVTLQDGAAIEYTRAPIAVEGVFKLDEYLDPQRRVGAIYHLEEAVVN
jgi:hypothetical protein